MTLLLLPVAILFLVATARRAVRPLAAWRKVASLGIRGLSIVLLTLAMARLVIPLGFEKPFLTIFAVDVSDSLSEEAEQSQLGHVRDAWAAEIARGNRCALIVFAGRAETLVRPSDRPLLVEDWKLAPRKERARLRASSSPSDGSLDAIQKWTERIQTNATDLTRALETARGLFQESAVNRIVLVTDGRDTGRLAREIDLPPETICVRSQADRPGDVAVVNVEAPLVVRAGEPFDVRVTVHVSSPAHFALRLALDDEPAPELRKEVTLSRPGRAVILLDNLQQKRAFAPGLRALRVFAEAPGDPEPRNNIGAAAVFVTGKPKVLLVEGSATEADVLSRMLQAQDIEFVREPPAQLAARSEHLDEFVAVALAGVPREALSASQVEILARYLKATGGGLWIVGSPLLRGPQGYAHTEVERLLPVEFTDSKPPSTADEKTPKPPSPTPPTDSEAHGTPQKVITPTVAMLFIIDKSGSMAGRNINIVKAACIASAKNLTARDMVGVLAFDVRPKWVLHFTDADQHKYIEESILRLYADGGTHIYPALLEAFREFESNPRAKRCALKHALLLSDGDALPADFEPLVRKMAEAGITLSTVCVSGPTFNAELMYQLASWGRGKFKFTSSFNNVPEIFTQEITRVIRQIPHENDLPKGQPREQPKSDVAHTPAPEPSSPKPAPPQPVQVRDPHEILQGIDAKSLPPIRGKLGAAAKAGATVPLATADGQPVLAMWRVGLGKAAVWTSDLSASWSPDWLSWKDSGKLFAQLLRYLSSAAPDIELAGRLRLRHEGNRAIVHLDPGPPDETLSARSGAGAPVPLEATPDGGATFVIPLDRPDEPQILRLQRKDGKNLQIGAIRSYDAEYAPPDPERDLFSSRASPQTWAALDRSLGSQKVSGERPQEATLWLILGALFLLPLDVALRRYSAEP